MRKTAASPRKSATRDDLYRRPKRLVRDFSFGRETAAVFDDMLDRSVPFYQELQRMIGELAQDFAQEGSRAYDLGCSTANTLILLDRALPKSIQLVGVDSSPEMLGKAREKLRQAGARRSCELIEANLDAGIVIEDASVVVMNLTLQFIRPLNRHRLMKSLVDGMRPQGCLLLIEKVLQKDSTLNRLFIKHYYEFKERQGYSRMEIAQKREALENVLIPYRLEENIELLRLSGFASCEVFFKWYNFCGILAVK